MASHPPVPSLEYYSGADSMRTLVLEPPPGVETKYKRTPCYPGTPELRWQSPPLTPSPPLTDEDREGELQILHSRSSFLSAPVSLQDVLNGYYRSPEVPFEESSLISQYEDGSFEEPSPTSGSVPAAVEEDESSDSPGWQLTRATRGKKPDLRICTGGSYIFYEEDNRCTEKHDSGVADLNSSSSSGSGREWRKFSIIQRDLSFDADEHNSELVSC